MIFIDRSVPRGVADAVKKIRDDVLWLEDKFPHSVSDEVWLARAGREGWLVITHDRKVRTRPCRDSTTKMLCYTDLCR